MRPQILGGFDTFIDRKSRAAAAWVRGLHDSLQPYAEAIYVNNLEDEGEE